MESLRNHRTAYVKSVRTATPDDLAALREPARRPQVLKLRDAHWNVIRLLAYGMSQIDIARNTGYSLGRINQLAADPAIVEQVAKIQRRSTDATVERIDYLADLATSNMMKAERMLSEKLDDEDAKFTVRELVAVSADRMDRFGYGKRQTTLNVNLDFAAKLEAAIQRSGKEIELKRREP